MRSFAVGAAAARSASWMRPEWEWVSHVLLAVATNTALGLPVDPVLFWYASGRPRAQRLGVHRGGSLCAGAAGAPEVSIGRRFPERRSRPSSLFRPCKGNGFYLFAAAVAAFPLPFTGVGAGSLPPRPRPIAHGASVAAGRLPRYALTVRPGHRLCLSGGAVGVVVAGGLTGHPGRSGERGRGSAEVPTCQSGMVRSHPW